MQTDCIVPAHNEAPRIAAVLRAVKAANCLRRILVVDDGSTDSTGDVAESEGASVLLLSPNRGKGGAMLAGFRHLCSLPGGCADAVCFVDADLTGLRPDHVCEIVQAVANRGCGQACGLRDYGSPFHNEVQKGMPILTGERCVRRDILDRVPARYWDGFKIECAINEVVERSGRPTCLTVFDGVTHAMRYEKRGEGEGVRQLWEMADGILATMTRMRSERF